MHLIGSSYDLFFAAVTESWLRGGLSNTTPILTVKIRSSQSVADDIFSLIGERTRRYNRIRIARVVPDGEFNQYCQNNRRI